VKGLQFLDGIKVVDSARKTGFVGFILGLQNAIEMYQSLHLNGNLAFFLTYKISQDYIKTTFSAIRSRLGYNDNPTCMQFKAAYKRILVHNKAVGSIFGNRSILDNTKNLSVTEKAKDSVLTLESTWLPQKNIYIDHDYFENYTKISSFVEDTSMYIGGFIVKRLLKKK